jgi:hypothetical protein
MGSNYKLSYGVDLVFCIDATQSMDHILDTVKDNALNFYQDFKRVMDAKNKPVAQLRVKIIAFRDYLADGNQAMMMTDFFQLPNQAESFRDAVNSIVADGGGDDPEDGLEAVAFAIKKSDWSKEATRNRHVIVVWSDDAAHPLGFCSKSSYYPKGMAKDFDELSAWWGSKYAPGIMDEYSKRMILFTPDAPGWREIRDNWNKVIHYESDAGDGLRDCDYDAILSAICNTI